MIKAVFFDIDGTLVSFKSHRIPASALKALDELRRKGIRLFIASGRHKLSMNNLENQYFDGYVTLNGGLCLVGDRIIYKHALPAEDMQTLLRYLEQTQAFPCVFVQEKELSINFMNDSTCRTFGLLNFPAPPVRSLREIEGRTFYQLLGFFTPEEEKRIMPMIPGCRATRWNPLFTDIVPIGSSKKTGIERLLHYFGIRPEECLAFGDGGNDIEMLEYAGTGIAMGNASEEVKNAAGYVTADVDQDGIAVALKHFGLL